MIKNKNILDQKMKFSEGEFIKNTRWIIFKGSIILTDNEISSKTKKFIKEFFTLE